MCLKLCWKVSEIGPSGVGALLVGVAANRSVHYFCNYLSSFCATYFSPRRVYATLLKPCVGSNVPQYIYVFNKKKYSGTSTTHQKSRFGWDKLKNHRRGCHRGPNYLTKVGSLNFLSLNLRMERPITLLIILLSAKVIPSEGGLKPLFLLPWGNGKVPATLQESDAAQHYGITGQYGAIPVSHQLRPVFLQSLCFFSVRGSSQIRKGCGF